MSVTIHSIQDFSNQARGCYSHLELGAANYGPEDGDRLGQYYANTSPQQHDLLYLVAETVLERAGGSPTVIFYLNDISETGLNVAAEKLKAHLIQKMEKGELPNTEIKIVKIAADMFKIDVWPKVDSANLLHPFDQFTGRLLHPEKKPDSMIVSLLSKVTAASKSGLLLKDANLSAGFADHVLDTLEKGPILLESYQLRLEKADEPKLDESIYVFPNGNKRYMPGVSYRIFRISQNPGPTARATLLKTTLVASLAIGVSVLIKMGLDNHADSPFIQTASKVGRHAGSKAAAF